MGDSIQEMCCSFGPSSLNGDIRKHALNPWVSYALKDPRGQRNIGEKSKNDAGFCLITARWGFAILWRGTVLTF